MKPLQRILYAEDDPGILLIARVALESLGGLEVCFCATGEEALAMAPGFQPDLILLDVMMPGLSGLETMSAIQKHPQVGEVPVCFLTAKSLSAEINGLMQAGATAVINKPFDPVTLPERLREIWRDWHKAHQAN